MKVSDSDIDVDEFFGKVSKAKAKSKKARQCKRAASNASTAASSSKNKLKIVKESKNIFEEAPRTSWTRSTTKRERQRPKTKEHTKTKGKVA